jgi:hypothetical protein
MNSLTGILLFIPAVLLGCWFVKHEKIDAKRYSINLQSIIFHSLGLVSLLIYTLTKNTLFAWLVCLWIFVIFNEVERIISSRKLTGFFSILSNGFLVALVIVWIVQLETNFAEEEFYSFIKFFLILIIWILTNLLNRIVPGKSKKSIIILEQKWVILVIAILTVCLIPGVIITYQQSFYSNSVPQYPGINTNSPFICGESNETNSFYDSRQVHQKYLEQIINNSDKETPEYGLLAVATRKEAWAKQFKQSILSDAQSRKYTNPANSIKYYQYEAALRAYYYAQVISIFPDLFTTIEIEEIENWFTQINQRALTVEWVDWLYALAFAKFPQGPYANQEIGSGLLSLLELEKLADPELSPKNVNYLSRNISGWLSRFRNTDDAVFYQPEWQDNALFQFQYNGYLDMNNLYLSNAWLMLQAPPDGSFLQYNQPSQADLAGSMIRAASLTNESDFLWLAGKSIDYMVEKDVPLYARPGSETIPDVNGTQPIYGSCLIYGDSGLPNQIGPLAPDKVILRDGWSDNSTYLLMNLRFTGWHRYKATNAIISIYKNGPIILEKTEGINEINWLPQGRSLFRDKRIPRENLNGLSIPRSGMDKVVASLTGIGSSWSQDPPHYASVEQFTTSDLLDTSQTQINDWRGWLHTRTLALYHDGPLVVTDAANGPDLGYYPAIFWHLPRETTFSGNRVQIEVGDTFVEMVLIPLTPDKDLKTNTTFIKEGNIYTVQYLSNHKRQLLLMTVFLFEPWVGAKVWAESSDNDFTVHIQTDFENIVLPVLSFP